MTKEQTNQYFLELINKIPNKEKFGGDDLIQNNLAYFIDRYYNSPNWAYMQEEVENLLKKGDLVGLSFYIFKAIQKYRQTLLK
ncbi:MAG: hypothetical protein PWQ68_718 [Thermoanaerobacteraceae bacterium]|nr:hypothetical protein [Thermoanaerobacteraceae bacterium]